ncbi:hypothetical protein EJ08DRAFT_130734 [Tothia fuscella]|uniref:Uncharacterized protein n=1 Tax=Tothia fuscella TaxID=1048955 RepID=A0A9P4NWD4_9PEZI|nr:hypothetical protein EJ08DRAFT_130734 [Tothia fuscella]
MGRYILTLLGLVCITSFVACAPLSQKSTPLSTSTLKPRQSAPQCGFEGNPDFYGLGIRIGVYLQWITAFSANHLLEEAIDGNLETNTIFLLALFIATLVTTVQGGVRIAELIVLLHLSFGFLFSILSIWGHRVSLEKLDGKKIRFPLIGSFFRLTLATAVSAYALWFWFSDSRLHGGPASCADFTFFFAKLDIAANIRTFFEIQTSLVLATFAILFVRELIMIICFFVFMSVQTVIISGIAVWFGAGSSPEKREKIRQRREKFDAGGLSKGQRKRMKGKYAVILDGGTGLLTMFKQWYRLSFAMGWKQLNGKESAGANRPDLRFYLIPFLDVWLFLMRSTIQFLCLLFFKKCPKVDFIPLMNHPLWSSDKDTTWKKFNVKLRDYYESKYTQKLIYTANAICIVWTIISVELTLYWNGITDVYTLNSTGQLIPFIIGAVGFVRLLHGLSVVRSKVSSTDVLLQKKILNGRQNFSKMASKMAAIWTQRHQKTKYFLLTTDMKRSSGFASHR